MKNSDKPKCKNCETELAGLICHQCGQRHLEERWSTSNMIKQFFQQVTNLEKGFLNTVKNLFSAPDKIIIDYWERITIDYYNPFRYVLIWLAINLIISFWLGIDDLLQESLQPSIVSDSFDPSKIAAADQKFDTWLNAIVLLLLPLFGLITRWLFKKSKKNYAEHLIMNAYMMGQQSLITSFTHFIFFFIPALFPIYLVFNFLVGLIYNTYVLKKVFREKLWLTIAKAILLGVIGLVAGIILITIASSLALLLS